MKRWITTAVLALSLGAVPHPSASAGAPEAVPAAASGSSCVWLTVTGEKVAVRRPAGNETSANLRSRVDHYVYRGDRLRSCLMTFNRGDVRYRACGRYGRDWYIVRGGQIPETCVRVN
ncbi:hypothetical protein [Streptomyces sp. NPDC003299]|jgi:hypothetical protein